MPHGSRPSFKVEPCAALLTCTRHPDLRQGSIGTSLETSGKTGATEPRGRKGVKLATDGAQKPCPKGACCGILTFQSETPVPGTGGRVGGKATDQTAIQPETAPGWSCSRCQHTEWVLD